VVLLVQFAATVVSAALISCWGASSRPGGGEGPLPAGQAGARGPYGITGPWQGDADQRQADEPRQRQAVPSAAKTVIWSCSEDDQHTGDALTVYFTRLAAAVGVVLAACC
jgi:hypothetical protein